MGKFYSAGKINIKVETPYNYLDMTMHAIKSHI